MPLKLKVDLHTHSAEDIAELVAGRKGLIPAKEFIDLAIEHKFDAISFTHHGVQFNDRSVFNYAKERGLLLIPGIEIFINRKHVLLINFNEKRYIHTFEDLKKYSNDHMLVIAPHPYYLAKICLGRELEKHIEYFDAIEYCHYYYKFFNLNKKAVRIAKKYNLPLIGNSDTHHMIQFGTTYSYVYAEEKSIPAIITAIKQGKVEWVSHPQPLRKILFETKWLVEKAPYELQMEFRKRLKKSSTKFIKKVLSFLNNKI